MLAVPVFEGGRARAFTFDVPTYVNPFEMEPTELVAWLEDKEPAAIGNWRELGAEEYARSFTAARTMGYDIVRDLYDEFGRTIRTPGATSEDFARRMLPIMREKGWLVDKTQPQKLTRLDLIFNTNLRVAQAVGRWQRIQSVKAALPYLHAHTAGDSRVRHPPQSKHSDHRAFEGILLPVDHPFWLAYFPPLGFRCRCSVVQKSRGQVARAGLRVTSEGELAERTSRLGKPWGFNPGLRPLATVEAAAEESNAERLPGAPPIEPQREAQLGRAVWNAITSRSLAGSLDELIERLFA